VVTRAELRLVSRTRSQETLLASLPTFDAMVDLLGGSTPAWAAARGVRGAVGQLLRLQHRAAGANAAPLARGAPFYVIAETLGGDPEHDRARLERCSARRSRRAWSAT
jgi:hypothetical protein